MQIILYTNKSDKRELNKNITQIAEVSITLKNDTDIINPVIVINGEYLPPSANYCYIPVFARYYFLTNQRVNVGKMLEITMAIDVLMSWKTQILKSRVIAMRSTNKSHRGLPDEIPILSRRNIIYKRLMGGIYDSDLFGSDKIGAEKFSILLTVINGQITPTLDITAIDGQNITLSWSAIENANYFLERRGAGGEWAVILTGAGTEYTDYVDAGTWQYRIRALIDGTYTNYSNVVIAKVG